jgi:zinc transport system permease protein
VSPRDLWLIVALDAGVVVTSLLFYNKLQAVCFDEEFARLRGIRVEVYYLLLLGLTALTVVLLVSVVGIVLVIALLSLPAAVAGHFSRTLRQMMVLATLLSAVFTTVGIAVSYQPDLPSGAVIIVLAGAAYIAVAVWRAIPRRRRRAS